MCSASKVLVTATRWTEAGSRLAACAAAAMRALDVGEAGGGVALMRLPLRLARVAQRLGRCRG